jgi:hypothetical protein
MVIHRFLDMDIHVILFGWMDRTSQFSIWLDGYLLDRTNHFSVWLLWTRMQKADAITTCRPIRLANKPWLKVLFADLL